MTLQLNSLTTLEAVYEKFMGKFYSYKNTMELRTKIATFAQIEGEPFHEVCDQFKQLLIQCMVNNAARGAMGEKKIEEIVELHEMLGG